MRHTPRLCLVMAGLLSGWAGTAAADPTQNFVFDLTAPTAISQISTTGTADLLTGARGYARFSDGHISAADFVVTSASSLVGALAQTSSFLMSASTDFLVGTSFPEDWRISNTDPTRTLVGFGIDLFNGGLGRGAFDINFGANFNEVGTDGSSTGRSLLMDFTLRNFIQGNVVITYSLPLSLNGAPALGDLFGRVDVALAYSNAGLNGGLPPNTSLSSQRFFSDLDAVTYSSVSSVPEPPTTGLLLAGAFALWLRSRLPHRL